jgi:hypothetical protein
MKLNKNKITYLISMFGAYSNITIEFLVNPPFRSLLSERYPESILTIFFSVKNLLFGELGI